MKRIVTGLVVLFAVISLVFGTLPAENAQAARKKSKTSITVSTQEELVKALKSGKYKKITIKTDAKISFTLAAKYSNSELKIVVDAKNATFNSKGTVGSIVVNEAKTVKEYASGNNITVNDEKLTFKAMEGSSVEKLKIASETGSVKLVNNGEIGRVDVTGESKVDVEQNGSVGRLYVAAAAEIGVTGTSEEKLAVTVKPEAAGAAVKSELPVKVNAYADVDLQLEKGAENSAVTLKNEDAEIKLENNTDKKVTVTDTEGEKQTVNKGEDLTTDNFIGKPEEPDTTEGTPVTEQPKEEEKKDEENKEEKKDDTSASGTGTGTGTESSTATGTESSTPTGTESSTATGAESGTATGTESGTPTGTESGTATGTESGTPTGTESGTATGTESGTDETVIVPTATELLIGKLNTAAEAAKSGGYKDPEPVYLTSDLTLTENITIPTGVLLVIGSSENKVKLDADSHKITLKDFSNINIFPESQLSVASGNMIYSPTDKNYYTEAMVGVIPGGEFNYGAYKFIADADEDFNDPDCPICVIKWWYNKEWHWDEAEQRNVNFFATGVSIRNDGGIIGISGEGVGLSELPDVFNVGDHILNVPGTDMLAFSDARNRVPEDGTFSYLEFTNKSTLICEEFVTNFGNETVYKYTNSEVDWLNAYLDPERVNEIAAAEAHNNFSPVLCSVLDSDSGYRTVTIPAGNANGAAIDIKGELRIPVGSKLVTYKELNMSDYSGFLKIMGTFESRVPENDGLGVISSVIGTVKETDGIPHLLVEMCGPKARLILYNGEEYFFTFSYSEGEVDYDKIDPKRQGLAIETWNNYIGNKSYINTIWEYIYIPEDTSEGTPHWMVYKKTNGLPDSDGFEVVNHPFKNNFIKLDDLRAELNIGDISDTYQLVRFLDWSNSVAWLYVDEKWNDLTGIEEITDSNGDTYVDFSRIGENAFDGIDTYQNIACHNFSTASNKKCVLPSRGKTSDGRVIPWDFGGVTLTVPEYNNGTDNALRLKQETNLKVAMGGTLIVGSVEAVSENTNAGQKALALEYDDSTTQGQQNKGARIDVLLGGALQIGNIRISVPDNCTGDAGAGQPGLSLTAEYDDNRTQGQAYLRLQVPNCAGFTKADSGEIPTASEINTWLTENNISMDFVDPDTVDG